MGSSLLQTARAASKMPSSSAQSATLHGVPVLMGNSMGSFSTTDDKEVDWVVVVKESEKTQDTVHQVCQEASKCTGEERALGMTVLRATGRELEALIAQNHDEIESIEADAPCHAIPDFAEDADDTDPSLLETGGVKSWGLDRIDARQGLDNSYNAPAEGGQGVHVYVTDTGIRTTHNDFGSRAIPTLEIIGDGIKECNGRTNCARDVDGHGTHCAGTVGGTQFGVAKGVTLHAVKILDDSGWGQFSWWTEALDWIVEKGERPAVVSASMGGEGVYNFVKTAVDRTVRHGVVVVVAAGNENDDACRYTPAFVPSAINVGATQNNDRRAGFSNYGRCLDIFAPGVAINSAGHRSDAATAWMDGTSMACPHVAGAAALLMQGQPDLEANAVADRLMSSATPDAVTSTKEAPNRLLYVAAAPAECKDLNRKCATKWKNRCHKPAIERQCPLTCGKCGDAPPTTAAPSTTAVDCRDKHAKCATKWSNRCHRAKVRALCPLTCGECSP